MVNFKVQVLPWTDLSSFDHGTLLLWKQRFINLFTRACHWTLIWTAWTRLMSANPYAPHFNITISSTICPNHLMFLDFIILIICIWWQMHVMKPLTMIFSPFLCYFHSLRSKHFPYHCVLKHLLAWFTFNTEDGGNTILSNISWRLLITWNGTPPSISILFLSSSSMYKAQSLSHESPEQVSTHCISTN
jgi:hypothetical protein